MRDPLDDVVDQIARQHAGGYAGRSFASIDDVVATVEQEYNAQPDAGDLARQGATSVLKGAMEGTRTITDFGETVAKAGAGLIGPGAQQAVAEAAQFTPAHWIGRGLAAGQEAIPDDPEVMAGRPSVGKWIATEGARAGGQAIPFLATAGVGSLAGLGARGAMALTAATGVASNAVSGYEDAVARGASPEQAAGSMLVNGGLGVLEAVEPAMVLARLNKASGGGLFKTLTAAYRRGGEAGMLDAAREIGRFGLHAGGEGLGEGITEGAQTLGENAYAGMTYDDRRKLSDGVGGAAGGGTFAGALLSALTGVHTPRVAGARNTQRNATEPSADFTDQATQPGSEPPSADFAPEPTEASNTDQAIDLTGQGGTFAKQVEPSGDAGGLVFRDDHIDTIGRNENKMEFVATGKDGKPVGVIEYAQVGDEINVEMVTVRPDRRREGIAKAMLAELRKAKPQATINYGMAVSDEGRALLESEERGLSNTNQTPEQPGAAPTSPLTPGTEVRAESRSEQTPPATIEGFGAEAEEGVKPKPPPKGRDATESVPHYGPDREATGVKNRTVDAELQSMGLDEAEHDGPLKDEDVRKRAVDTFNDDNLAGSRLADELAESDRTATADEIGLLTLETARRKAEHRKASEAFRADQTPATRAALDKAAAEYGTLADTVTKLGTRQAQAFRLRQMMMRADYSLAEMEHRLVEAKDGEPLTEAEHADLAVKAEKIADLQKRAEEEANASERERRIRALEDAVAQLEKGRQRREYVRGREARVQRSRARITELFGEFKRLSSRARTGLDADSLKVLGQIAAEHIKIGFNTFAKFAAEVKGKLDEAHHKAAWDEGLKVYRDELIAPMRERMKAGATLKELHRYVLKIADSYHRDGVTDREKLVDAVTGAVQAIDPKVTRDQIIVAIPDYGNYKPLSKEEHAVGLRKIKGELREIAKLKDLERGLAPKKTGPERGEPSDEQRRLAKQVREKMKALGIKTTNADTQIKSALESAKTRTRNAINDLTTAIDTRTQIKKGERVDVSDAELVELKAQRAELEKVYADLFVGPKDDPKIRTLVDSIADLDKRIAAGDTSTRGAKQGPEPRADIAALKAERAEKAKTLADMRKEAEAKTADERLADQVKRLTERRDKLSAKLFDAGQGGSVDPKGAKQGPDVARVAELKAEIASLNETIGDIRDARDPKLTDEQRATASAERRAQARLEREQARMRSGDFEPVKKEPVERFKSAKEIETLTELDLAKRIVDRGREAARRRNRTKLQVAIDAAKEVVDLPRAIKSSWDLSAPFRQGMFFTLGHPIKAGEFAYQMIRAAKSPEYAERISQQLKHRHLGAFAERSRLELTGDTFTKQEEAIRSALSDKIPGIKRSNAAYQTFLNLQRAWMFDTMVQGLPNAPTIEQGREIARIVNIATGRGDVGKFAATVKGASYVLWAPRLLVSRFQLLAEPARQAIKAGTGTGDAGTRKAIAKEYARTLAGLGAVYAAAQFAGLWMDDEDKPTVSLDVTSSDFGKIRIGNTRIDPLAGLAQITVLLGRHEDMAETVAAGGTPKQGSDSTLGRFLRYKLAPDIAVPIEILSGKNAVGEKRTPLQTIGESVTPLAISDVYETMQEQGVAKGTAISILAIFGMGVQTYEDKKRSPAHTKAR